MRKLKAVLYSTYKAEQFIQHLTFAFPLGFRAPPVGTYNLKPSEKLKVSDGLGAISFGLGEGNKTLVNVILKDREGQALGICLGKGKSSLEDEQEVTLKPDEIIIGAKVDTNVEC